MQPLRGSVAHVSWSIGLSIGPGIALGFYGNSSEADLKVASEILSRDPWQTSGRLRRRILKLRGEIYSGCQVDWIRRGTNKNATYSTGWRIRKKEKKKGRPKLRFSRGTCGYDCKTRRKRRFRRCRCWD